MPLNVLFPRLRGNNMRSYLNFYDRYFTFSHLTLKYHPKALDHFEDGRNFVDGVILLRQQNLPLRKHPRLWPMDAVAGDLDHSVACAEADIFETEIES